MNHQDKRVIHTRRALRMAMLNLLKKKPLSQITVKEICDLAEINRNTFYAHYGSPADILSEVEAEYMEKMGCLREKAISDSDNLGFIEGILNLLLENRDLAEILYGTNYSIKSVKNYQRAFSRIMVTWIDTGTSVPADHLAWLFKFMAGGVDSILRAWVQGGMKESPRTLAKLVGDMCDAASSSIFSSDNQDKD